MSDNKPASVSTSVTTTTVTTPYREQAPTVPLAEHQLVVEERDKLRAQVNRRATWGERFARLRSAALSALVVATIAAATVTLCWWVGRGIAWGDKARGNAEHAATVYARQTGHPSSLVYCNMQNCNSTWEGAFCTVTYPPTSGHDDMRTLCCDDDNPVANDGCVEIDSGRASR